MEKISCNVIQDMLPLYIEHTACEDTAALVEAHLEGCEACRKIYDEVLSEISYPVLTAPDEPDAAELRQFKKFLLKKRLRAMLLSMAAMLLLCFGLAVFMNRHIRYIECEEAGLTYVSEDENEVRFTDSIKGFYRWINTLDRDTGIMTIHYEQSLWARYMYRWLLPFDHVQTFLKKDLIKVVYLDSDGSETVIWEANEEEKEAYFHSERGPLG